MAKRISYGSKGIASIATRALKFVVGVMLAVPVAALIVLCFALGAFCHFIALLLSEPDAIFKSIEKFTLAVVAGFWSSFKKRIRPDKITTIAGGSEEEIGK